MSETSAKSATRTTEQRRKPNFTTVRVTVQFLTDGHAIPNGDIRRIARKEVISRLGGHWSGEGVLGYSYDVDVEEVA